MTSRKSGSGIRAAWYLAYRKKRIVERDLTKVISDAVYYGSGFCQITTNGIHPLLWSEVMNPDSWDITDFGKGEGNYDNYCLAR